MPEFNIEPTQVTRAIVYKGDTAAGELSRDRDTTVFRYLPAYLESPRGAIATTLPLTTTEFRQHSGAIPPFFAGLLPEGRRLLALQSSLKTSPDDEYSQLIAVGRDCIGDIRVLAEGETIDSSPALPSIEQPGDVSFNELLTSSLDQGYRSRDSAIPGVQDKISNSMISIPVAKGVGGAILKLNPPGLPHLVENEAYFLDMARAAGLRVPGFSLIRDRDNQPGLAIDRLDRQRAKNGTVRRIAQEDAVQLAARWPASKYRLTVREVFESVLKVATAKPVVAEDLLRLFMYSYLIGNGDLHGKNVSVYFEPDGIWSLTPAYDLVCTLPYGDHRTALFLDGRDKNIRGKHFAALGERFGLGDRVTRRVVDEVTTGAEPLIDSIGSIELGARPTAMMESEMHNRIKDLRTFS